MATIQSLKKIRKTAKKILFSAPKGGKKYYRFKNINKKQKEIKIMSFKHNNHGPHKDDNKNLGVAIVISLLILGLFHYFYEKPRLEALKAEQAMQMQLQQQEEVEAKAPEKVQAKTPSKISPKVAINSDKLKGHIDLSGARINNLHLKDYTVSLDDKTNVQLLASTENDYPYYSEFGWLSNDPTIKVPTHKSVWSLAKDSATTLTPTTPITLEWNNGQGVTFLKKVGIDENYLFKITQHVVNKSDKNITLFPYGLISRHNIPEDYEGLFIVHEGPVGYMDGSLQEYSYDDLQDDKEISFKDQGGWIGFGDKYWLTALLPDATKPHTLRYAFTGTQDDDRYQSDYRGEAVILAPNTQETVTTHFFAGAKVLDLLDSYEEQLGIQHLDLAIDFGWFYFMTKPFLGFINFLYGIVGNFGIAIIIFTILIRLGLYPFANKTFRSMARMKQIAPQLEDIKKRHGDDRMKLQQKIMELYQKEKVSPLSGCMPMIIQIPIFFALYKVLYVTIEMRHAPFFGWIHDLSQPDPTSIFNLFGLIPFEPFSFLMIGAWPCIMCLTLIMQQRLNPKPQDPIQAKVLGFFPFFMTYILASFPAGLVIYWTFSNIFSIAQQAFIMKRMGMPVGRKAHAKAEAAKEGVEKKHPPKKAKGKKKK